MFDEFLKLIHKSMELDPWVIDKGVYGYTEEIINEAKEAANACRNNDNVNLKEELGDVLYDWANACMLAERDGIFTMEEVVKGITEKIKRRKPYLFENRAVTKEEAVKIWHEVKKKEKDEKVRDE